ncbi:MAG: rhodopsin [Micrococcales bacterium]|nr:rhodopsin [Micrococcales bacterium]
MNLLMITQAMFMLGFVSMAAATFYFVLQRGEYKPENRVTVTYAATITFIAAIMYWQMKDIVGFGSTLQPIVAQIEATMPVRYLDWVLTTPLLLLEFGIIAAIAGAPKGLTYRLIVADLVMIITGYLGEIGPVGSGGNYVNFVISSIAWLYIIYLIWNVVPGKASAEVKKAIKNMKLFVIFGWAIYPIGTAVQEFLQLNQADAANLELAVCLAAIIYVVADVVNKVGFGIVALSALKKK